jgi:hypothetical protein
MPAANTITTTTTINHARLDMNPAPRFAPRPARRLSELYDLTVNRRSPPLANLE